MFARPISHFSDRGAAHHAEDSYYTRYRPYRDHGICRGNRRWNHQHPGGGDRRFHYRRSRESGGFVRIDQRHRGGAVSGHSYRADRSSARYFRWQTTSQKGMKHNPDKILLWLAAIVLLVLPFAVNGYVLYIVNLLMVYIVLALGLHIVIGETGQFALSHAAFYGIGTYTAGILTTVWNVNFLEIGRAHV